MASVRSWISWARSELGRPASSAAKAGNWDEVVKLEGACVLLISQLKHAAREASLDAEAAKTKSRIMQRILMNDAEIRHLAEPWLAARRRRRAWQAAQQDLED